MLSRSSGRQLMALPGLNTSVLNSGQYCLLGVVGEIVNVVCMCVGGGGGVVVS